MNWLYGVAKVADMDGDPLGLTALSLLSPSVHVDCMWPQLQQRMECAVGSNRCVLPSRDGLAVVESSKFAAPRTPAGESTCRQLAMMRQVC